MTDNFVIRAVVIFLGLTVLLGMGMGGYLAVFDKSVPDFIIATTSGAIGGLAALLAKTSSEPQLVRVENPDHDPVPVEAVPVKAAKKKR